MVIEIICPTRRGPVREFYVPRSGVTSSVLAHNLAKKHSLLQKSGKRGPRWQLRGPIGPLHPNLVMKNVQLNVGECLKLEIKQ